MTAGRNTQTFAVMFTGYERAVERFNAATKSRDPTETFIPLFEALNWAVVLDERTSKHWAPDGKVLGWKWRERVPAADTMAGVRYARNRAHHQWADALILDEGRRQHPRSYPVVYSEWLWRASADLPPGNRRDHGEALYQQRLEGRAARGTLAELVDAFAFLRRILEPSTLVSTMGDLTAWT